MSSRGEGAVADLFFALGDTMRLSVVRRLVAEGAASATSLAAGAAMTAIVKHLQVLEGSGLVRREKRGREVLYAVEARRIEDARVPGRHSGGVGPRARALAPDGRGIAEGSSFAKKVNRQRVILISRGRSDGQASLRDATSMPRRRRRHSRSRSS